MNRVGVTSCLADTVRRDYRSLFGNEPDDISGHRGRGRRSERGCIDAVTLDTRWQTGDAMLLERAASRQDV